MGLLFALAGVSPRIFFVPQKLQKAQKFIFSARIFLFKLSHGLHRCFHIWITEKFGNDGNDGNLLLYYMIVEGGVGVFAYNTLNFIVLRYICGCLGRWHFGMSDMVRLFGVPFGIQKFFFHTDVPF